MRRYLTGMTVLLQSDKRGMAAALAAALTMLITLTAVTCGSAAADQRGITGAIASKVHGICLAAFPGYHRRGLVAGVDRCTSKAAQSWTLPGDNTVRIKGKCLQASRKTAGAGLVLATCSGSDAQFWEADGVVRVPGDELLNPWSGKCMEDPHGSTAAGTQVRLGTCSRSMAQTWYLPPSHPN